MERRKCAHSLGGIVFLVAAFVIATLLQGCGKDEAGSDLMGEFVATTVTSTTTTTSTTVTTTSSASDAPTPMPTPQPPAQITMPMTIQGVDYTLLMSNQTLLTNFEDALKTTVASKSGSSITKDHVTVTLSPGSVRAEATIVVPEDVDVPDVQQALEQITMSGAIVTSVEAISGIEAVTSGTISAIIDTLVVATQMPTPVPTMATTTTTTFMSQEVLDLRALLANANLKIARLEASLSTVGSSRICRNMTCTDQCASLSKSGRWRFGQYGHDCADEFSGKSYCHCSAESDEQQACSEVLTKSARRLRASASPRQLSAPKIAEAAQSQELEIAEPNEFEIAEKLHELGSSTAAVVKSTSEEPNWLMTPASHSDEASVVTKLGQIDRQLGSHRETITTYCNATGLLMMHGLYDGVDINSSVTGEVDEAGVESDLNKLESSVLSDIADEMETNNMDKVARDIFTFYVCVRWVPDSIFWELARHELAANLIESVIDHNQDLERAIAELYQTYKFVPLICSRNYNVFEETDEEDGTYFRDFKKRVTKLIDWFEDHSADEVAERLHKVDEVFCGGTNMNDPACNTGLAWNEWLNGATSRLGSWGWNGETTASKWETMKGLFKQFHPDGQGNSVAFTENLNAWKAQLPFHSFVHKPEGMASGDSPLSEQRYLVCFGKRVASELHRRPAGQHIIADQNNVGCHGFWEAEEVKGMLDRMVELWRPPTCQMADMVYQMKRHIIKMYSDLNARLFDAIPTMVHDERLDKEGMLEAHVAGPPPYDPQSGFFAGVEYVDGMRVRSNREFRDPGDCEEKGVFLDNIRDNGIPECRHIIYSGDYGILSVHQGQLKVVFDEDADDIWTVTQSDINIVPRDWHASGGNAVVAFAWDLVAGVASIADGAWQHFNDKIKTRYTNLASLMSGSTSKWVVCPLQNDVNFTELDSQLGVEDAAFRDHTREAYAKWTGYKSKLPGEVCEPPTFFSYDDFPKSSMCEISEMHADHLEKYTNDDGSLDEFICPIKSSLPASEQLTILQEKKTCFVHMTAEHQRHYQWPYNGDFPARRQYDRKPNVPNVEYELIYLEHVPENGKVSFARSCSVEEFSGSPRFCPPLQIHATWPTLSEMADAILDATVGSLGMGSSSIMSTLTDYKDLLSTEYDNFSSGASAWGSAIKEDVWDGLTGAGRLLNGAAKSATASLSHGLPSGSLRDERIEKAIFQDSDAGLLLHQLSFQQSIGSNGESSNAKERYQRVVATMPCKGFNPALEFALKKKFTAAVLKMVQSSSSVQPSGSETSFLEVPVVKFALRGEGRFFWRENSDTKDVTWYTYGAALTVISNDQAGVALANCAFNKWGTKCEPEDQCEKIGTIGFRECVPKVRISGAGWWNVLDTNLLKIVAPVASGGGDGPEELFGFTATLYCGEKSQFNATQGSAGPAVASLMQCMQDGVKTNARLRAASPWKLYFPEEVIVVAVFQAITERQCQVQDGSNFAAQICAKDAVEAADLDAHLTDSDKSTTDGAYQGLHAGASFPKGVPYEIIMRPEDVLEVVGVMSRS